MDKGSGSGSGIFPDPDPGDRIRADPDPDPQHCFKHIAFRFFNVVQYFIFKACLTKIILETYHIATHNLTLTILL